MGLTSTHEGMDARGPPSKCVRSNRLRMLVITQRSCKMTSEQHTEKVLHEPPQDKTVPLNSLRIVESRLSTLRKDPLEVVEIVLQLLQ